MYCCICLVCMHRALSRCMLHFDLSICNAKVTNYHESANYMPALFIKRSIFVSPPLSLHSSQYGLSMNFTPVAAASCGVSVC